MTRPRHLTITTKHPASRHGLPVILDDDGRLMDPQEGVYAAMDLLDWDREALAQAVGLSRRSIESYFGDKPRYAFTAAQLNVIQAALEALDPKDVSYPSDE